MTSKEKFAVSSYLDDLVNRVYKVLGLYEDSNIGLEKYLDSLLIELGGMHIISEDIARSSKYCSVIMTLASIQVLIKNNKIKHSDVKSEVFKCISLIKKIKSEVSNYEKTEL